jgi:hypothetical protein
MLIFLILGFEGDANRKVNSRLLLDIKHLLSSLSEYGNVANVPQQHLELLILTALQLSKEGATAQTDRQVIIGESSNATEMGRYG